MEVRSIKQPAGLVRAALLAGALLLAVLALGSASAKASTPHKYCDVLLPPEGSCTVHAGKTMEGNLVWFPGTKSNLKVCQSVFDATIGSVISSTCGVNSTGSNNQVKGSLGHDLFATAINGSAVNAHTVIGNWFSP